MSIENIRIVIIIYVWYMLKIYWNIKCLHKWQKATFVSLLEQQETKNICWEYFRKTEQKHGFTTWTTWNHNVQVGSAKLTKVKERNKLQI